MAQNDPWAAFRIKPAPQGPSQGDPVIAPADPYKQSAEARANTSQALQIEAANRARTDQQLQMDKANRDRLEWQATHNPDGTPKVAVGPGKPLREGDVTKLTSIGDNLANFDRLTSTFQDAYAGNSLTGGLENSIQSLYSGFGTPGQQQWWSDVAAFDNVIRNSQFGASLTPGEKAEYDKTTINPSMDPKLIRENLARRMEVLRQSAQRRVTGLKAAGWNKDEIDAYIGAQLDQVNAGTPSGQDQNPPAAGTTESAAPPANPDPRATGNIPGAGSPTPGGLAGGNTQSVVNTGVNDRYRQLLGSGASGDDLVAYLKSVGINDERVFTQARQQANYRDQFPRVPIENYPVNFSQQVPLSAADQAINAVGQSPAGAYAINAGQAVSGGTLDNIAGFFGGNPERVRAGIDAVSAQNPISAGVGTISGGVMAALGGEAALARAGVGAGAVRSIASDATYGAASGAGNADNGNRLQNALLGAGVGAGASALGTGAANALGRLANPGTANVDQLYNAGVTNMTFGQRAAATGTAVGNAINSAEQKLQSLPVIGSAIRGARQESRDSFQIGAFNDALKEVGESLPQGMKPGTAPQAYAQKTFDRVYAQARTAMKAVPDDEFANDVAALSQSVDAMGPATQQRLKVVLDNYVKQRFVNGELTGKAYKNTISDLGKKAAQFRKGNTSEDQALADAIESIQTAIDNSARRHSDPEAVALLDAADAGYAKLVRIEDAARRAGGDPGTFTPTQFDRAVQNTSGGVRSKSYLRGDALMQDYATQGKALVDTVPNSGTADRAIAGATAAGSVALSPKAAIVLGGLLAAYAPGARRVMQAATGPAGPTRKAIAQQLEKRARLVGSTSAASAVASSQGTASAP